MQTSTSLNSVNKHTNTALILILSAVLGNVGYTYLQQGVWLGIAASYDYNVYHLASTLVRQGRTDLLYDIEWFYNAGAVGPYLYFPFFSIILYPLSLFSFEQARIIWMVINQGILVGSIWLVITSLMVRDIRIILGIIILFLGFGPMHANMWWGNVNALIMLCILTAWWAYKHKRPWLCGLAIGLGAVIKITPAILGVYFLYKREYRVAFWSLCSFSGCVLISMIILGGYDEHYAWYTNILPWLQGGGGKKASVINQAFLGLYLRLAQNGFFADSFAYTLHQITEWGILILSFTLCRFKRLRPDAPEFDMEFACITCLTVLMPQVIGPYNYIVMFSSYFIVLLYLINHMPRHHILISLFYGVSYMLVSLGAFGSDAFSRWPLVLFQSSKLFGGLILYGMIAYLLLHLRRDKPVASGPGINQDYETASI